jgi:hypothetical protein
MTNWLEDALLGGEGWVSPSPPELVTNNDVAQVLASYAEPGPQKTVSYRVNITCEETPVNNDAGSWTLDLAVKNASGVFADVFALATIGGATNVGLVATLAHNPATHLVEVTVTGIAARFFKWRCVRLETSK